MEEQTEWVEIFGFPKHKSMEDFNPNSIIKIPDHIFIKIEVEQDE